MIYKNLKSYVFYELALPILLAKDEEEKIDAVEYMISKFIEVSAVLSIEENAEHEKIVTFRKLEEAQDFILEKRFEEIQKFSDDELISYYDCGEEEIKKIQDYILDFSYQELQN